MTAVSWYDSRAHIQCDIFSIEAVWYIRHNNKKKPTACECLIATHNAVRGTPYTSCITIIEGVVVYHRSRGAHGDAVWL